MSDFVAKSRSDSHIDDLAEQARRRLDISPTTFAPDLRRVLFEEMPRCFPGFKCNIVEDSALPGAQARATTSPPRILVSASVMQAYDRGDGRARFTLAHEIGHFFMHPGQERFRLHDVAKRPVYIEPSRSGERQANRFAQAFLIRPALLEKMKTVDDVSSIFQVSRATADIAFQEHVVNKRERTLPEGLIESLKRELAETSRRAQTNSAGFSRSAPIDEKERLWNEAPEAAGYDPKLFRLASNKWLIAKGEFRRMTQCGWTIANGSIVAYFPNQIS